MLTLVRLRAHPCIKFVLLYNANCLQWKTGVAACSAGYWQENFRDCIVSVAEERKFHWKAFAFGD